MNDTFSEFVDCCHAVAKYGLVRGSSGNLSNRTSDVRFGETFMISSSGTWLENITETQVAVCKTSDLSLINENQPSSEIHLHAKILEERKDVKVVLHFQSPCATALSCLSKIPVELFNVIPEVPFYIQKVGFVSYCTPGSKDLAIMAATEMATCNLLIMQNHGLVTVGADYNEVLQRAIFFELACEVMMKLASMPSEVTKFNLITDDDLRKLAEYRKSKQKDDK